MFNFFIPMIWDDWRELGVVGAVQPVHLQTDWPTADKVWGERARYDVCVSHAAG